MSVKSLEKTRLLRVLHIGVSNRGTWPLRHCNESTGFVPAALCDVSDAALEQARAQTGLVREACFANVDEALASADVDCAIICAPTVHHVSLCKKAIDAGLAVLVEKGMAPDWNSACDLVRYARDRNARLCVAQNYRYGSTERTIWRAINDPTFAAYVGQVHLLMYTQNRVRPIPRTLTYPFASVWDMSCHHFDNMLYWLGRIEAMSAFSWKANFSAYEHDNNTTAHIVFANAARAHYIHTHDAARAGLEVQVHGERGALIVRDDEITFNQRPREQFGTRPLQNVRPEAGAHEADLLRDCYRYVVDGIEPGISAHNNLETMAACEMMVRSITRGQTVQREELGDRQ